MQNLKEKFYLATKNILEENLEILKQPYCENKVVLVYDIDSELSKYLSEAYIENLKENKNSIIINFNEIDKEDLKELLLWLEQYSTVVLVQSTNFRLDNFRIRLSLHNAWVWCLEHNHLSYIKDYEIENYADSIEYKTPYYDKLSEKLKEITDNADNMKIVCNDWSELNIFGWFEDMKQNTGNYTWKKRWWTMPIWENFTESANFENVNWELTIYAYPSLDFQVNFCEPFKIKIENSIITCDDKNAPKDFLEILGMIYKSEDNEIMMRELWFGLNPWISKEKTLSDVNSYERKAGFHISLWKKHGIYRKKMHRKLTQRYHIDIFPDIKNIFIDNKKIFEDNKYLI